MKAYLRTLRRVAEDARRDVDLGMLVTLLERLVRDEKIGPKYADLAQWVRDKYGVKPSGQSFSFVVDMFEDAVRILADREKQKARERETVRWIPVTQSVYVARVGGEMFRALWNLRGAGRGTWTLGRLQGEDYGPLGRNGEECGARDLPAAARRIRAYRAGKWPRGAK